MKYSEEHAWINSEGDAYRVGLSDFAQQELGELTFIELPSPGDRFKKGDVVCSIDSLKAASDVYAPVSGTVTEVNPALSGTPGPSQVNSDPLGKGWLFAMNIENTDELDTLMSKDEYRGFIES